MGYKRQFKGKKSNDYMDNSTYTANGTPEGEKTINDGLSVKAGKNLPKSTYSIQADPYTASLPGSGEYPILNALNKRIGSGYRGNRNLDGGNVQQYAQSLRSKFLQAFDYLRVKGRINYLFQGTCLAAVPSTVGPDNPYVTSGLIDQARNAVAEAVSQLSATTFTNMAIYNYVLDTDLPMGTAKRKKISYADASEGSTAHDHYVYTNVTDVIFGALKYYQIVLQELDNLFTWHNTFRMKMGPMIRNGWQREQATLNDLFGLFKKKSFLSMFDSIALNMKGEYFDRDWATTVNKINVAPSRRANDLMNPLKEVQINHIHPTRFVLLIRTGVGDEATYTPVYQDITKMINNVLHTYGDLTKLSYEGGQNPVSRDYWHCIEQIMDIMSAQDTAYWARNNMVNAGGDNARFNQVKYRLDVIKLGLTSFKTLFNDVREVLDVLSRTGIIKWVKGFRPSITKDTDCGLFDNMVVNDIIKMAFSGPEKITFHDATKRWETFSLWDMYRGFAEFDAFNGGAFLTFSCKTIDYASDSDATYAYVPLAFDLDVDGSKTKAYTVSRDGYLVSITSSAVKMSEIPELCRLVPLDSQANLKVRIPTFTLSDPIQSHTELSDVKKSFLIRMLENEFDFCKSVTEVEGGDDIVNYYVNSDIVAIYQVEIEDITNDAINFARSTSPLVGTSTPTDTIGFASFGAE